MIQYHFEGMSRNIGHNEIGWETDHFCRLVMGLWGFVILHMFSLYFGIGLKLSIIKFEEVKRTPGSLEKRGRRPTWSGGNEATIARGALTALGTLGSPVGTGDKASRYMSEELERRVPQKNVTLNRKINWKRSTC